ncbi:MAG: nucleoside-triphosphatase [Ezakiella sp.]|nr:nucleoside-triphosphatase [Ezakiella sp.]
MSKSIEELLLKLKKHDDGKKHILITGGIKTGKTTLLRSYIDRYYSDEKIDGLITELINDEIRLKRYDSDYINGIWSDYLIVGKRMDKMEFNHRLFDEFSRAIYNDIRSDIIVLDEIGKYEMQIDGYIDRLIDLFQKNRVFAVVKKKKNPITKRLCEIGDYIIFDIDVESRL